MSELEDEYVALPGMRTRLIADEPRRSRAATGPDPMSPRSLTLWFIRVFLAA